MTHRTPDSEHQLDMQTMYGVIVELTAKEGILLTLNGSLAYIYLFWSCLITFVMCFACS